MAKVKERILKAAGEKQSVNYKGTPIRLLANFSTESVQARRECQDIVKVLKGRNLQPRRILYPARVSFKIEGGIKNFSNKQKLKEYSNTKPILKEILKELLLKKKKEKEKKKNSWSQNSCNTSQEVS